MPKPLLSLEERRAKRLERRAKQRAANVGRAAKMHTARVLANPYDTSEGKQPAVAPTKSPIPKLNIGCSGWFYWHWRGRFYPPNMPTRNWFSHYVTQFNTVELNAPFYSWPTLANVKAWIRQTEEKPFIYTVKVSELITHVKQFARTSELVKDFGFIGDLLKPYMGCFLFQLPPSFHYSAARLTRILKQLDPARRNVVEFRHRSWWNDRVFSAFEKAGVTFCSCSGPRLPDELVKTSDEVYVRFHGTKQWYRHDYTADELIVWVKRIRESKPKRVWAYFNNDGDGYAIANARELLRQLSQRTTRRQAAKTSCPDAVAQDASSTLPRC